MDLTHLTALSPLDGRYFDKVKHLRSQMSEFGLIHYRIKIELYWLIALTEHPEISEAKPLSAPARQTLEDIINNFQLADAKAVKEYEKNTNHDVKAVEYFLQEKFKTNEELKKLIPFIHFGCTSEDINNLAYALMIRDVRKHCLLPQLQTIISLIQEKAHTYATIPMLSRTHGQPASPTTLGKEFANFVYRLKRQKLQFQQIKIFGKFNGAVGNYNAHQSAYPQLDWLKFSKSFVTHLGLEFSAYTTQIEPHDFLAEFLQCQIRIHNILIDLSRDIWAYTSLNYFHQQPVKEEIGSSTMPHKVNPIDFENAEGNLGVANALANHLANKLPISRWQRDLTDSTVLRNLASITGYSTIAYTSLEKGLSKISANETAIQDDLNAHWEVLGEAIQTVLRRYGCVDAYERLKTLTRGKSISANEIQLFISELPIPDAAKTQLSTLSPQTYHGLAVLLARKISNNNFD